MEFIEHQDGKREPIPDAVIAASDSRDLVAKYISAGARERERIYQTAIAATTPPEAAPAVDAPASTDAPVPVVSSAPSSAKE